MKLKHTLKYTLGLAILAGTFQAAPAAAFNANSSSNWAGPYVGVFGGGTFSDFSNGDDDSSFLGGGNVGNNWQWGRIVMGAEGDFGFLDNNTRYGAAQFNEDWMSTIRGRLGYSVDRFLPYVTGGLALTHTVVEAPGSDDNDSVIPGYAVGGGVDTKLTENWIGRLEYLHTDVPRDSTTIGGATVNGGSDNDTFRVALNYRF